MNSSTNAAQDPATPKRKFAFDTVFDAGGSILRDGTGFKSQYTAAEVAEIRAAAFEEGRQTKDREIAAAISALTQSMAAHTARLDAEARQLREEAASLALAAARKAADFALSAHGEDRIVQALVAAMETLRVGPRVAVRIAPDLVASLKSRLEEAARAHGFDGALMVRADPGVAAGDVTIEWAEGAIFHDRAEAFARIEEIVAGALGNANLELIDE